MNEIDLFIGCNYQACIELVGSREAKVSPSGPDRIIKLSRLHFEVLNDDVLKLIKGIPLTTEIIEKMGGELWDSFPSFKSVTGIVTDWKIELGNKKHIIASVDETIAIYVSDEPSGACVFLREIQFVHELQNAFHGISGKELEFKL